MASRAVWHCPALARRRTSERATTRCAQRDVCLESVRLPDAAGEGVRADDIRPRYHRHVLQVTFWVYVRPPAWVKWERDESGTCSTLEQGYDGGHRVAAAVCVFRAHGGDNRSAMQVRLRSDTGFWMMSTRVLLTSVTLTVTPASQANSTETSGLRVDGRDTLTQTPGAGLLGATSGLIKFRMTPRHSAANVAKFGETTPYLMHAWGDASNYLALYWSAANTLKLEQNANGAGVQSSTWDATGAIVAGTTYACEVEYNATAVTLTVDSTLRITVTAAVNFTTALTTIYWGHKQDGTKQADATFSAPV